MKLTIILLISLPLIWASSNASPSLKSRSDLDLDRHYDGHYYNGYYYPRSPDYYGYPVTDLLQWFLNNWYPRVTDAVPRLDTYNLDGLTSSLDTMGDLFTNTTQKLQQLTSLMQQYQACMGQARSANHEEELEDDRHYYNYYGGSYSLAEWQRRTLASRDALVADMAVTYRSCTPLQSYPDPILVQAIRNLIDAIVQLNRMISGFTSATPQLQNIQGSLLSELDTAIQQMQQQLQNCQSQATQAPVAPTLAPTQAPTTQAQGVPTLAPTTQQPNTLAPATTAAPTEPPISGTPPGIIG